MMMVPDLSIITRFEGYCETYSLPDFKARLNADLSSKEYKWGWFFWRGQQLIEEYELPAAAAADDEELDNITPFDLPFSGREIEDKVKYVLDHFASTIFFQQPYLAQFWAPEEEVVDQQQHLYLTTKHQPFAVGHSLCKGFCRYRERCMGHRYRADEGAYQRELGAVGRVYRNKYPESTPDLRLYSTNEFPLRDFAAHCGLRGYFALPIFDLLEQKCCGVIEILGFQPLTVYFRFIATQLSASLKAAQLRTTHLNLHFSTRDVDGEITKMLELANRVMPQLHMAQVWVPCRECSDISCNLSCMEQATFIVAGGEEVNSWEAASDYDESMFYYLEACNLHHLPIGKYTNMIAAVMSSDYKSCICRNICDFSISENPLAHYAQEARLSFCFAICVQSLHNSRDFYVVKFFLQFNSREDEFGASFLPLLLRIMEMELKNFKFAYKGQHGDELVVEVLKENMLCSGESSQSGALRYESIKCKHQHLEELSMLMVMEGCHERYPLSDFTNYLQLQKADLHCLPPSTGCMYGWVFWSQPRQELRENEVNINSSLLPNRIQEKIKHLMSEITSKWHWNSCALAQFWAPKMDVDRCYLETSGQPFALGRLHKGLAFFRRQCMEHSYFVDEAAKEEELGPPGRAFRKGHPEITPDLRLYSPTEFPLRNHAAHCGLRKYFALPVFELNQHECVGVLEFVEFGSNSLQVIEKALEAANLGSTHIKFEPSFRGSHLPGDNAEPQELALTEIRKARIAEIPQLYMVEVWVPYSKCPISINNTLSCMELAWTTGSLWKFDQPMRWIQYAEIGKGVAGMALASENKSCFCQNLSGFSIADQPLAHHAREQRLDICFAICLQSWHTGDLLYVLEFYLNQGPGKYEYLRSFLCLLLPIMKQKLKSFKVASGQQLGEKLVVEVIQFSEVDELAFSDLDQQDKIPVTFKFVKYGVPKLSKDIQMQLASDNMESGRIVAQTEHCSTSAASLKKKDAAKGTTGGKKPGLNINLEDLEPHFGQKLKDVAKTLGVSKSTIKRRLRDYGIQMWPWNQKQKKNRSLFMRESANETAQDPEQNMRLSGFSNLPPSSDTPLHQNVPHTNPESSQGLIMPPKVDMVFIKAKYGDDTIKFELCHSAGMEKLVKEVAMRLNLEMGSFKVKYLDEDNDEILLACDTDLQLCLESLAAVGKPFVQMIVQSI